MRNPTQRLGSRELLRHRGVVLVWVAILSIALILMVGLMLDTAKVLLVFHQMQNTSDAAALAGATFVRTDRGVARDQAIYIAGLNSAEGKEVILDRNDDNNPDGDIVIGWYNIDLQTFTPAQSEFDAVNAMAVSTIRSAARPGVGEPVRLNFGPMVGVRTVDVTGRWRQKDRPYAIAMSSREMGAALIALAPEGTGLYMNGNFSLHVQPRIPPANEDDGEVQINSRSYNALDVDGRSTLIEATAVNITGHMDVVKNFSMGDVPYTTEAEPIDDPLAWVEPPTPGLDLTDALRSLYQDELNRAPDERTIVIDNNTGRIAITGPQQDGSPYEIAAGYYPGGFNINSNDSPGNPSVSFKSGVHILGGRSKGGNIAGLVIGGASYAVSDKAMFYITGDGIVNIGGNAGLSATEPTVDSLAPDFSKDYAGITIFQDRANTNEAYIKGTSDLDLNGTLYFPRSALVNIRGGGWGFGSQLIGWRFDIRGSGTVGINYDGRNRRPKTASFLIE